jgi:primosomal protein N' (replication factor Y)
VPEYCENCKSWRLTTLGIGVEKIEEETKKNFPEAKIFKFDKETAPKAKEQKRILKEFFEKGDILISTSLIFSYLFTCLAEASGVAREGKFPLTIFVSFNSQLSLPNFRFEEKLRRQIENLSFLTEEKLLLQNSSRKEIFKKTWKEFYDESLKDRKEYLYPPFSQLIKLTFEHKDPNKAKKEAYTLKEKLVVSCKLPVVNCQVLGPAPAFISKIKGKYRWNILIKIKMQNAKCKMQLLSVVPPDWKIDINPIDFY